MRPIMYWRNRRRGFSIIEMSVALGITAFIFAVSGSLIFFTTRNTIHMHEQFLSQRNAGSATERLAQQTRNAIGFERYAGDTETTVTRIKVVYAESPTTTFKHTISRYKYDAPDKADIRYYTEELQDDAFSGTHLNPSDELEPAFIFPHLADFQMVYQSQFHLTLVVGYIYRGFALLVDPFDKIEGRFVTDIIARNHAMDIGVDNYAEARTTSPASLGGY